jgi:hypothetical protein
MSDELDRLVEKIGDAYFNRSCGRLELEPECLRQAVNDALVFHNEVYDNGVYYAVWGEIL